MIVLIILGFYLEKLVGKGRFLVIYIVSGITAALYDGVVRILFNVPLSIPLIGASGAIMGMAAFLAIIRPHEKVPAFLIAGTLFQFILFIFPIIMMLDAFHQILIIIFMISMTIVIMTRSIPLILFVLIQIISIIWSFFYTFSPSISYLGHFGGMVAGLLLVFLLPKKD
jgi:membrane associated rhomboid family serine protease